MENRILTRAEIETYAKHMICPKELADNPLLPSEKGIEAFNHYPFRQSSDLYCGDSKPSLMIDELIASLNRGLNPEKEPIILLSDGKDSMSIALALSKMNRKCKTLTLLRAEDHNLRGFIEDKCKQMNHTPFFVEIDDIVDAFDGELFAKSCSLMDNPVLDQGMIFFLFGLKVFFEKVDLAPSSCQFIDGLGNDEHLGYLPSKSQMYSYKLSKLGIWKFNKYLPNFLNWYIRSPAESQGDLSALACFFDFKGSNDLNSFFSKIYVKSDAEFIDFRSFCRGAYHDHQCMISKTKVAAYAHGAEIFYPWTDPLLSAYCFNLPKEDKFNIDKMHNKVILRELLQRDLSWMQSKRGVDLFIDLDVKKFIAILSNYVSNDVIDKIMQTKFITTSVKKRALLELLNLSGYLYANDYSKDGIRNLLFGENK
ncbi:hypothetical protein [Pseudoalteromonas arctica]|uniref:Asparagine synthetase domain-containing protein n=1 Tax=Pseudoalteromonas arctica TaxID=394751 RepID=A0ABU9TH09_9GAMM